MSHKKYVPKEKRIHHLQFKFNMARGVLKNYFRYYYTKQNPIEQDRIISAIHDIKYIEEIGFNFMPDFYIKDVVNKLVLYSKEEQITSLLSYKK